MYHLTRRMCQHLRKDLQAYHAIFQGRKCSGWELEELFVRAIKSDTTAQHHVQWKGAGHDQDADIRVRTNGTEHPIQIKSGQVKNVKSMGCIALVLSGYRLTRFEGNLGAMTEFLNCLPAPIIAMPCCKEDGESGRAFIYTLTYIDQSVLTGLAIGLWKKKGSQWRQTTESGVLVSLTEKMSWQVWWRIPLPLVEQDQELVIQ